MIISMMKKIISNSLVILKKLILTKFNKRKSGLYKYEGSLLNLSSNSYLEQLIILNGEFESHITDLSKSIIKKGEVVFDVGANVGLHTVLFSTLVGEEGKVIAFEPNPDNLKDLRLNLAINGCNNVVIVEKALADENKKYDFYQLTKSSFNRGDHSLAYTDEIKKLEKEGGIFKSDVNGITLDTYCDKAEIRPTFLKMDIEGFEYFALKGGRKLLNEATKLTLIIEFKSQRIKSIGLSEQDFAVVLKRFDCYEILRPDIYNEYSSLRKYNFDRVINCDLFCIIKS